MACGFGALALLDRPERLQPPPATTTETAYTAAKADLCRAALGAARDSARTPYQPGRI